MYAYPQGDLFSNIILNLLALMTLGVFIGVIYAILYAVFMFIFSWWNEQKITKAWNSIRYALVWFVLTLIILFAIPGLLRAIKVPWYRYYTSENVFKTAKRWVKKTIEIFNNSKPTIDSTDGEYQL